MSSRSASRTAGGVIALLALAGGARGEEPVCPPFGASSVPAAEGKICDGGIVPSKRPEVPGSAGGPIVSFEAPDEPTPAGGIPGEALLALPKRPDGSIPTDFELAPGAQIADSFFSPVLCATVARVVGPPGLAPEELVPVVPDGAVVVPHDRYAAPADPTGQDVPASGNGADPYLSLQYGLDELGVPAARPVTDGSGAVVAVLDSAPDTGHRELARVRAEPIPGGPVANPALHGTLVAGVIAAIEGNAFGIAGAAPGADFVAIPVCRPEGATASDVCRLYDVLRGIDLAWEARAQVLNLSLVGRPNLLLERAATRLEELGPVVVAAAGNEGTRDARYPAAYPTVIGVGATDPDGRVFARSNRGPSVQILAPGVEILTTAPGGAFAFGDGTSLAAAHVTAALALLTAASGDARAARAALFGAGEALPDDPATVRMPALCRVLARLGKPCPSAPPTGARP